MFNRAFTASLAALLATIALPTAANAGWVYIENEASGLVLDIYGGKGTPLAPVAIWSRKVKGADNQLWQVTPQGFIESKLGVVLDIDGRVGPAKALSPVIVFTKKTTGNANQLWAVANG